jgi:NAD(P)-dependent dehydrogenase (short-subunit alcohol dehydrogenase family)
VNDLDLADAVVLVTGATDGIGRASALRFARRGATVLVHGRDAAKADAVVSDVRAASDPADAARFLADFADPAAVRSLAGQVRDARDGLDVLVNNAGTWQGSHRTADGWGVEYTVAVNHLAPFLLTNLLVPALLARDGTRVVTVSSALHRNGDCTDLDALFDPDSYDARGAYADSKLANVLFTVELADRLEEVAAHAVHPGTVPSTSLARDTGGLSRLVWKLLGYVPGLTGSPDDGARTVEYAATSPDLEGRTGRYVVDRTPEDPPAAARDAALRERLWERSAELSGLPATAPGSR